LHPSFAKKNNQDSLRKKSEFSFIYLESEFIFELIVFQFNPYKSAF